MNISVLAQDGKISVHCPYTPEFPGEARRLGGRFDKGDKAWRFDARDEQRVRDLLKSTFGSDGSLGKSEVDLVTARVTMQDRISVKHDSVFLAGRMIARATSRDSGAKLGAGVVVLSGEITSGGSMKNWTSTIEPDAIFEIRDLPRSMIARLEEDLGRAGTVEAIEEPIVERNDLADERARLLARIAEIDVLMNGEGA